MRSLLEEAKSGSLIASGACSAPEVRWVHIWEAASEPLEAWAWRRRARASRLLRAARCRERLKGVVA